MGNSVLWNTAGSIALAVNYVLQGPYNNKFLTKQASKTVRINAEFYVRVDGAVFCIESDVDLTEADLDEGSSFGASQTYHIYGCYPLDGSNTPVFKISLNSTYPTGWNANNSRKIGGFDTDGSGNVNESTLWDLRTVDVILGGVTDGQIPAGEISLSKLKDGIAHAVLRRTAAGVVSEDAYLGPQVNLLSNAGFGVWSNATLENVGSDLVTNGGFDSDTSGWTPSACTIASVAGGQSGNCLEMTHQPTQSKSIADPITLTAGKLYKLIFYAKNGTLTGKSVRASVYQNGETEHFTPDLVTSGSWQSESSVFEAINGGNYNIYLYGADEESGTLLFDTVTLYEVTPGCVAADNLGPDGWRKDSALNLYREHNGSNTKDGEFYALKIVGTASAAYEIIYQYSISSKPEWYQKFAGRIVTFGAWVKCDTPDCTRIAIADGVGITNSSYHTGGGSYEWIEATRTIDSSPSAFIVKIQHIINGAIAYISQPMLVFGSSIGEGNYVPPQNKMIWLEQKKVLTDYDNDTISADTTVNLEAQSAGAIPKDTQSVLLQIRGACATAGKNLYISADPAGLFYPIYMFSQVANIPVVCTGLLKCDNDGNVYIIRNDTWTNVYARIYAVEMR
jgi:hypothetical protein